MLVINFASLRRVHVLFFGTNCLICNTTLVCGCPGPVVIAVLMQEHGVEVTWVVRAFSYVDLTLP